MANNMDGDSSPIGISINEADRKYINRREQAAASNVQADGRPVQEVERKLILVSKS